MLGYFLANGVSSQDYDVYLTDANVYGTAEQDIKFQDVAGRNGSLILDNNRFKNKSFSYPCIIRENFDSYYSAFTNYLLFQNKKGYIRLEDSFDPEKFVLAVYTGGNDPSKVITEGKDGVFKLPFNRKPQRFLKSGEKPVIFTSSGSIINRHLMTALPTVRVYGTGYIQINGVKITITSVDQYVDIDCETQNAYKGSTNCNSNIILNNKKFFELVDGENPIVLSGVSRVEIKPNWWTL